MPTLARSFVLKSMSARRVRLLVVNTVALYTACAPRTGVMPVYNARSPPLRKVCMKTETGRVLLVCAAVTAADAAADPEDDAADDVAAVLAALGAIEKEADCIFVLSTSVGWNNTVLAMPATLPDRMDLMATLLSLAGLDLPLLSLLVELGTVCLGLVAIVPPPSMNGEERVLICEFKAEKEGGVSIRMSSFGCIDEDREKCVVNPFDQYSLLFLLTFDGYRAARLL